MKTGPALRSRPRLAFRYASRRFDDRPPATVLKLAAELADPDGVNSRGVCVRMLIHGEITEAILGCFFEVHSELGHGFLESVYETAMLKRLRRKGLAVASQVPVEAMFDGEAIGFFRADLLVEDLVVVELKAAVRLDRIHEAQLLNYLRCSALEVGLLLNFGVRAAFRRLVHSHARKGSLRATPLLPRTPRPGQLQPEPRPESDAIFPT